MKPLCLAVTLCCAALSLAHADGPDPKEIPVPPIATDLPSMPGVNALPDHPGLPDIMTMNDGMKVTTPQQWQRRREEMKAILSYYATGRAPPAPGNVQGQVLKSEPVLGGAATYRLIHLTFGPDQKLSLDVGVFTPAKGGPFQAIILQGFAAPPGATPLPRLPNGPNQGKGQDVLLPAVEATSPSSSRPAEAPTALPPTTVTNAAAPGAGASSRKRAKAGGSAPSGGLFRQLTAEAMATRYKDVLDRGFALAVINPNDCAEDTTLREPDGSWSFRTTRFFPAYPGYDWGILRAWAWGVSRVADYLTTDASVDHHKLMIVTGASRDGKSSMIAAAFDDRLMGAPVVTGGGGIGAYRYAGSNHSETLDVMMKKYPNWFSPHLHEFWGQREKLPFDEHWFLALCAPRKFIALEGDADVISSPDAVRRSVDAARIAYAFLGAPDNLAIHYSHHPHAFTAEDWTAMMDFAEGKLGTARAPIYNVRDFGAVGNGTATDTVAFQRALDTCAISGGGEVDVPAGHYLIGSVQLGYRTTLRLADGSVITGTGDLADYPMMEIRWEGRAEPGHRALIYATQVDHVAIVGSGTIEGNPAAAAPQNPRGAVVLEFANCNDVRWEGFTVHQGGNWATHPVYCSHVVIKGLTIVGGRDGIDVDSCAHVTIDGCHIDTGDDSISLKSGRGLDGARINRPTEDVLITGCTLRGRRFACIGIGSETSGGIKDVRIEHCVFTFARTDAIYIKTRIGRAGAIENISGDDLEVDGGDFLRINLVSSGNRNTADDSVPGLLGYPLGRNYSFRNVRVKVKTLVEATHISPEKPLQGLVLENITGTCEKGIHVANVVGLAVKDVTVTGYKGELVERMAPMR